MFNADGSNALAPRRRLRLREAYGRSQVWAVKKKVGGRRVVKVQLQGIDGPIGGLGTFTACTLFWPMVLGIWGVLGVQRRANDLQELVTRGR